MRLFLVCILALASKCVEAQTNETWWGCGNNTNDRIEIGQDTLVCFLIGNNVNWAAGVDYTRISFQPKADQYSRLFIPNSFTDLTSWSTTSDGKDVAIASVVQDQLSFLRQYYDFDEGWIYPFLTAIIDVSDGRVKGITWDDSCVFCGSDRCKEITYNFDGVLQNQSSAGQPTAGCYIEQNGCTEALSNNKTTCDLNLYVVWTGTDVNGVAFQSSSYRFSQFPEQEIQDRISNSLPSVPDIVRSRRMEAVDVYPLVN